MPNSPHDRLFKAVFSRPTEAASFLSAHLPAELAASIRWDELVCVKSSFESHDGASAEADLVFSTRLDAGDDDGPLEIEIAILFEHQSTPDDAMPLRLLGYMYRTFEAQIAERERNRPVPVIPVVLYHGERPWVSPTRLSEWMSIPPRAKARLADFIPDFRHVLETRRAPTPDAYLGSDTVRLIRLLLDHARSHAFFDALEGWETTLARVDADAERQGTVPILAFAISYLYRVVPDAAEPLIRTLERAGATQMRDLAMNTYEQAVEKGKQIGLSEGKQIGLTLALDHARSVLGRMCERRFGPLTVPHRELIATADLDTVLAWTENVPFADSLDRVFRSPTT